ASLPSFRRNARFPLRGKLRSGVRLHAITMRVKSSNVLLQESNLFQRVGFKGVLALSYREFRRRQISFFLVNLEDTADSIFPDFDLAEIETSRFHLIFY
ncbi:MAG: hypothetical protein NT079_02345, partial [Candidatus Omnitrophica bacterium]|nr:hypothetical protein [Candidatus Omnitrophota bacterium]